MQVSADSSPALSHIDDSGAARMVDVSGKAVTERRAVARARVRMSPSTARRVEQADGPKGDVIGPARLAGIMAAKRTGELIPLCHPLGLDFVDVRATIDVDAGLVELIAEARCFGRTGIEMEAMMAASIAALTVYDMVKGVERGVAVERVELLEKTGGKHNWRREEN
jgi:cyclic pyranopterin phosphate synthase